MSAVDLFDWAKARRTDPRTSKEAAKNFNPGSIRGKVLASLRADGPQTILELTERLGKREVSVSPRLAELRDDGLIRDSGKEKQNPGGAKAILWEAI